MEYDSESHRALLEGGKHNGDNDDCPANWADPGFGECECRNENDVADLKGQELLDALTQSQKPGGYKGWEYNEMLHGPSVLPMAVCSDDLKRIIKHTAIVMAGFDKGRITNMTLMVTTPEGTTYQDFVPKGPPTDTP